MTMMISLTFFVFVPKKINTKANLKNAIVMSEKPITSNEFIDIFPTSYYHLFQSAQEFIKENPITGIGVGNFQTKLQESKKNGIYPKKFRLHETHDM